MPVDIQSRCKNCYCLYISSVPARCAFNDVYEVRLQGQSIDLQAIYLQQLTWVDICKSH